MVYWSLIYKVISVLVIKLSPLSSKLTVCSLPWDVGAGTLQSTFLFFQQLPMRSAAWRRDTFLPVLLGVSCQVITTMVLHLGSCSWFWFPVCSHTLEANHKRAASPPAFWQPLHRSLSLASWGTSSELLRHQYQPCSALSTDPRF